ncbi:hypothetical protein BJX99DRAFT_261470 [Aspergillus californicus]
MNGLNASVSAGWYTFTNLGPLTTTFTPAPTCTSSDQMAIGIITTAANNEYMYLDWQVQCSSSIDSEKECMPTTTPAPTTTAPSFDDMTSEELDEYYDLLVYYRGSGSYYSPGVYCPEGWETIGMAGRDASSVVTSSGFLATTPTTTTRTRTRTPYRTSTPGSFGYYDEDYDYDYDDYQPYADYTNAGFVLKDILEPQQTMALCCPSGMTADSIGYCYSIVSDYKPTYGCQAYPDYAYEFGSATETFTSRGVVVTDTYATATATHFTVEVDATAFDSDETEYKGIMYAPVITLLHHESDVMSAAAASASSASSAAASETPTNAAGKLAYPSSSWEGVGAVLGIWVGTMALGVAMVLPW